mgnify:CR=1 FL=1
MTIKNEPQLSAEMEFAVKSVLTLWMYRLKKSESLIAFLRADQPLATVFECEELEELFAQALATARAEGAAEERERCVKIIRSHLLTDWSGETEVYEQIEQIAKKCEALTTKEHHAS